jgi:hypothetical protein
MDDRELSEMIRESIARQVGAGRPAAEPTTQARPFRTHASHALLPLVRGSDEDEGVCFIEPSVRCNHCGYCVSLGH